MKLKSYHHQAIQLMILARWTDESTDAHVGETLGINKRTVCGWRKDDDFKREYARQLAIYQKNFEDIQLADRKERVQVLNDLFFSVDGKTAANARLKMAILAQIGQEMGDLDPHVKVDVAHTLVGVNAPPRATDYDEWVQQNQIMEKRVEAVAGGEEADWEEVA